MISLGMSINKPPLTELKRGSIALMQEIEGYASWRRESTPDWEPNPLLFLLEAMNDEGVSYVMRMEAAKSALPYLVPKLPAEIDLGEGKMVSAVVLVPQHIKDEDKWLEQAQKQMND